MHETTKRTLWWLALALWVGCADAEPGDGAGPIDADAVAAADDANVPPPTDAAHDLADADVAADDAAADDGMADADGLPPDAGTPDGDAADGGDATLEVTADIPAEVALDGGPDADTDVDGDTPCVPSCEPGDCGDDGCGGSCGPCPIELAYDVVVAGAGCGGVAAALEAARLGMSVALLEETDWLGGQMTAAAVTSMDEGYTNRESGLYAELIEQIKAHYAALGKSIGTCYWSVDTYCFEPSVGRAILAAMVEAEPGIDLFLRTRVVAVDSAWVDGVATVTGVAAEQTADAAPIAYLLDAAVVVDATEYADLLPLSPAAYRAGNSTSDALDPSACLQDWTYTAVVKKYAAAPPADLVFSAPPPGYGPAVEAHFASFITADGAHWLSGPNDYPADWLTHVGYRGMPDSSAPGDCDSSTPACLSRSGVNWANDHPATVADLDPANRQAWICAAKRRTLQFLYYAQQSLGAADWAVADDEGFDTPYNVGPNKCADLPAELAAIEQRLPVIPYVREGRRVIGLTTVTAGQIRREVHCTGCPARAVTDFPTALAIGDYAVDLHGCDDDAHLETALETAADVPPGFQKGAFQVPFEAFVPADVDGLLVAEKNLSVTRLVNGAIRLQPIAMLTGQAAGAIAALSISAGMAPRELPPIRVQHHLAGQGCRLALQDFADVPRSDPWWEAVQLAATRGILVGYSDLMFGAADDLLRWQVAAVLVRLFGLDASAPPPTPTFEDVPTDHAGYALVEAVVAAGWTSGCSVEPPLFCPDDPVTRGAAAKFLVAALGWDPATAAPAPLFDDVASAAAHWSFPYVQLAAEHGLLAGCTATSFCPDAPIARIEIAGAIAAVLVLQDD